MKKPLLHPLAIAIGAALALPWTAGFAADEELENIVVTAQSRTQAVRDVPITVQVVTVQQIEDLGAVNLSDLNGYLPGLVVDGSQPTQPNFSLRGIGTGDFGIGTDAAVGVYVDGTYTGKTGGSLMNFNDIQRVEVLKGPQGTLFGRNSAAGAIAVVTNEPDQATDARALLRFGQHNTVEFSGMVNSALTDTTAVRLAVASKNSDGWLTNSTNGARFANDGDWGTRLSFKWSPGGAGKLIATWEHEQLDQQARPTWSLVPLSPTSAIPPLPNPLSPASTATYVSPLNTPLQSDANGGETRSFDGVTLRYETDLGGLHFSSNSAYRHFRTYNSEDNDGTANPNTFLSTINAEVNSSFQQEFKLAGKNDRLDWVAGTSYYHVNAGQVSSVNTTSGTVNTILNNTQGFPVLDAFDFALSAPGFGYGYSWLEKMVNTNTTNSVSLYGDTIWHLGRATNLTAGLRLTRDTKDVSWFVPPYYAPGLDALFANTPQPFGSTFGTAVPNLIAALQGGAPGAPLTNVAFNSAATIAANRVAASRSWGDVSPRLVLDHKLDTNTMVFASVTRGFQSGGYDVFNPLASFEPEHMVNYEAGIKGTLPAARLSYEASLFHYKFSNLQNITLVTVSNSLPVYDVTTSDRSATGIDFSGRYEVEKDVSVFATGELLRQQYDHYSFTDNISGAQVSLDGKPTGTPLLNLALGLRSGWQVADGKAEFLLQGTFQSGTRCNQQIIEDFGCLDTGKVRTGNAQTKLDLRLGWTGDHFGAAILVNNVLDWRYVSAGAGEAGYTLGTPTAGVTPPRYIGVEISANL